jgi:hypothetical protein
MQLPHEASLFFDIVGQIEKISSQVNGIATLGSTKLLALDFNPFTPSMTARKWVVAGFYNSLQSEL